MSAYGIRSVIRAPQVLRLLVASQIGRLPVAAAPLALLLHARQSLSLGMAGLLVAAYTAAMAASAPLLARAVDRWRQPPVLYASTTLSGIGFLTIALGAGDPVLNLVGAVLAGAGAPPLEACLRALWPILVPPAAIPAAYSLDIALQEVIFVAGPLVTLAAIGLAGPQAGVLAVSGLALPPMLTAVFLAADRLTPPGTAVEAFAWVITAFTVGSAVGAALTGPIAATGIRYGFGFPPAVALLAVLAMVVASRAVAGSALRSTSSSR